MPPLIYYYYTVITPILSILENNYVQKFSVPFGHPLDIYCFRALDNINKFDLKQHMLILDRIIGYGTEQITWSGGEALLVPHVVQLMKYGRN